MWTSLKYIFYLTMNLQRIVWSLLSDIGLFAIRNPRYPPAISTATPSLQTTKSSIVPFVSWEKLYYFVRRGRSKSRQVRKIGLESIRNLEASGHLQLNIPIHKTTTHNQKKWTRCYIYWNSPEKAHCPEEKHCKMRSIAKSVST